MEFERIKSLQHKSLQIWWNLGKSRVYNTRVYSQEFTTFHNPGNPENQEFTTQEFNPRQKFDPSLHPKV